MTPQELKNSILQLAIQGKLVEQRPEEGTAEELYQQIQAEKQKLIKEGKIKKEKPLPEITEEEKPFDIPDSWKWVHVGSIFMHNTGKAMNASAKTNKKAGSVRKFITTSNVYWNEFDFSTVKEMFFSDDELERCSITKNDLLMCEGGAYYGRTAIWNFDYDICFQNHVHRLRPYSTLCLLYFYYVFNFYRNTGLMSSKGTAMPGLSSVALHDMIIPLPPLAEQKRIVAKIEELLPLIDRYEKAWTRMEEFNKSFPGDMQKSLLQMAIQGKLVEQRPEEGTAEELYQQIQAEKQKLIKEGKIKKEKPLPEITEEEKPFDIPENWKWTFLSEVVSFQEGPGILAIDFRSAGVPLIRIAGMQSKYVSLEGCNYLDVGMVAQKWEHFRLDLGDIVISSSASLDKIAIVDNEAVGAIPYTGLIRFKMSEAIAPGFFVYFIKSPFYIAQINRYKTGGTIKHYGPTHLKQMVLPLPPLAEQKRIVARLEELLPLCDKLK